MVGHTRCIALPGMEEMDGSVDGGQIGMSAFYHGNASSQRVAHLRPQLRAKRMSAAPAAVMASVCIRRNSEMRHIPDDDNLTFLLTYLGAPGGSGLVMPKLTLTE